MATQGEQREKERKRRGKELLKEAGRKTPDLAKMRALLEAGADTERYGLLQTTPLVRLIQRHNVEGVKLMIEFHANLDFCIAGSPLYRAIENGDMAIAKLLVEAGASVDVQFLELAIRRGDREAVRLLLDSGVQGLTDVRPGTQICAALNFAEKFGGPEIVGMVGAAVEKCRSARPAPAPAADPRDQRIAQLEQQLRAVAASLTSMQRELDEIRNPGADVLDKTKMPHPPVSAAKGQTP